MNKGILFLFLSFFLFEFSAISQQTFQIDTTLEIFGDDYARSLRISIPDGVDEIKGILIKGNAGGGSTLRYVEDELANEFAKSIGFALMGTSSWSDFYYDGEIELFNYCIQEFVRLSGHTELVNAPVLFFGSSNGGMMAHAYNSIYPKKTIAVLVNKGRNYMNPIPKDEALKTPAILVIGEFDIMGVEESTNALFYDNRARGALWSHLIQEDGRHTLYEETLNLFYLLGEETIKLRYPENESPINGPVNLLDLEEESGWLSDSTTWRNGIIEVYEHKSYPFNIDSSSWHINKDMAYLFAAHSSYNRIDDEASLSHSVADSGSFVTFDFVVNEDWDSIHVYNKSEVIGTYYNSSSSNFSYKVNLDKLGFYGIFSKVYLSSGKNSITNLDAVFVRQKEDSNLAIKEDLNINTNTKFYPNPCVNEGNLESDYQIKNYIIYSIDGTKILQKNSVNSKKTKIDLSALDKGCYLIKCIFKNNQFEVIKVFK